MSWKQSKLPLVGQAALECLYKDLKSPIHQTTTLKKLLQNVLTKLESNHLTAHQAWIQYKTSLLSHRQLLLQYHPNIKKNFTFSHTDIEKVKEAIKEQRKQELTSEREKRMRVANLVGLQ